ncbi:MAG TPA: hypothetical protein VMP01_05840 [Pirellulaceae bacterium]|nr:hypothetical protein [Pirellulaceae bacterium]
MWRAIVLAASLSVLLSQPATAQDSAGVSADALRLQKYLRMHVSGGRIAVRQREAGQSRTLTAGQPESAYRQHLQLQVRPPCIVVQYEAVDPAGRLTLRLCDKRKLTIERTESDPAGAPSVRYQQPLSGPVKLTIAGTTTQEFAAESLWHLALVHPRECRQHLFPLLETLSPDWKLADQAADLEAALVLAAAEADVASDEKCWTKLVEDLGSNHFSRRQAADATLQQGGQAAAAFLTRLDARTMNAEQRLRVQRICQSYADGSTDTPQRAATWLLGDRSVWLAMLSSERLATRQAATEHLSRLVGRSITFDPNGNEKTRELQVAELARRIDLKK